MTTPGHLLTSGHGQRGSYGWRRAALEAVIGLDQLTKGLKHAGPQLDVVTLETHSVTCGASSLEGKTKQLLTKPYWCIIVYNIIRNLSKLHESSF